MKVEGAFAVDAGQTAAGARAQDLDTEPDEIDRADDLERGIGFGHVGEDGGEPGRRRDDVQGAAEVNAKGGEEPAPAAARDGLGRRVEDRRAGQDGKSESRGEEGDEKLDGRHGKILLQAPWAGGTSTSLPT